MFRHLALCLLQVTINMMVSLLRSRSVRRLASHIAVLMAFISVSANASQFAAPLPDGYQATGTKLIPGMYAEITGLTSIYDTRQIEEFEAACKTDRKPVTWQDRDKSSKGAVRIYRTAAAVAVIEDVAWLTTDLKECVARYVIEQKVIVKVGQWNYKEVAYFKDPNFKCALRKFYGRCHEEVVAGVKVKCLNQGGGPISEVICVSRNNDFTRGLLASYSSYIDNPSEPQGSWQLSRIEPNALIDPVVFRVGTKG
jgi:hypothetical protein